MSGDNIFSRRKKFKRIVKLWTVVKQWTNLILKDPTDLFAEPEEPDVVGAAWEAAGSVEAAGLDGLASDLHHDVTLPAEILVAQCEKVVDHDRWKQMF